MEPACATGCGAGQPPQGTGDTAFRRAERLFKQRNGVPPDTSAILSRSAPAAASGQPVHLADHAGHPGIPQGAYFLPGLLTEAEELLLARQALCVYPDPALPHDSNLKQLAKLQQTPAATPGPQAAGGARPAGGVQSTPCAGGTVLHTKALRWVTVGYFYNWTEKTYDRGVASPFPPELAEIAQRKYQQVRGGVAGLPEGVDFQCAIINYYNAKSTLMGHTDTYEAPEVLANPLLTISVGRSAVFLLGGLTRDVPPVPILLRSGDAVLLVGEARSAFHGVPCVLPRSCPAHLLESFPILEAHRVNFSLRQVFPAEGGGGGGVDDADPACVEASPPVKRVRVV